MAPYIIVALVYWLFAFTEIQHNRSARYLGAIGGCIFVIFAGLRFETGCDWMAYERYFHEIPDIGSLILGSEGFPQFGRMEPLFGLLNSILKFSGLNFQSLLFIVAVFNGLVLFSFLRRYSIHPMLCVAVYYCWSYLPLQMACIRQSIAYSFVILGIQALLTRKTISYYIWILIGSGFHCVVLPFLIVGPIIQKHINDRILFGLLGGGILVYLCNIDCVYPMISILRSFFGGSIAERIEYYSLFADSEKTMGAMGYLAINIVFVAFYRNWLEKRGGGDKVDSVCLNLIIILVLMQLYFSNIPIFWHRFRYIGVIGQACGFSRMLANFNIGNRLFGFCTAMIPSSIILSVYLSSCTAQVYVPYQSYITYVVTGDQGDGLERSEQFIADYIRYIRK